MKSDEELKSMVEDLRATLSPDERKRVKELYYMELYGSDTTPVLVNPVTIRGAYE